MKYQRIPDGEDEMANEIRNHRPSSPIEHDPEPDLKDRRINNDDSITRVEVESLNIDTAIPPGTIDPVYEAKARVLNEAVRFG